MTIQEYIDKLNARYKQGNTTEHSFRGDLQNVLESIIPDIQITNEPTRIKCGAPDYILTKKEIPVGYIEAKDLGAELNNKLYKEQFTRYKQALTNLIITNYLDFEVYKEGELVATYSIGKITDGKVIGKPEQYEAFTAQIKDFSTYVGQTVKSAQKLAVMMASKAKMLATVIGEALESDEQTTANSTLQEQYKAFQDILIHDITPQGFADIYAQTIAYGMFAARLHDPSLETFTRQEAAELIPKSNPFLRKLFQYIAGYDLDGRIVWIVDALADIFRATDVKAILKNFGKATKQHDPIIHFYETFLSEYDPKLRKSRGVWYTPEPVVNFIVRAVDDILITEFGLSAGLADTSKVKIKRTVQHKATTDQRSKLKGVEIEEEVHRVQILDPATGTGTFLSEVIRQIHEKFAGQQGIWSSYVEKNLIPRLNGFELLMASYAMAHLKLDMLLTETGYKPKTVQRLRVYLTNSLEEHHPDTGTLFANWLSAEANEANQLKRDVPVMVVLGNPPYSISSSNKSEWIEKLISIYKKGLNEKNIQPLSDDYIKFIRFGQYFIDKNGEGVLAYISNNSFIDGMIHREMRKSLLESFDTIYILDLHGNSKKKESAPDGGTDQNVFDIMQGVSINIFIKKSNKKQSSHGKLYHFDLFGRREYKYDFLNERSLASISWTQLDCIPSNFYFVNKNFEGSGEYQTGFKIDELFPSNSVGIVTSKDAVLINDKESKLIENVEAFYKIPYNKSLTKSIAYRVFDKKYIYYDIKIIDRARDKVMRHLLLPNLALVTPKQAIKGFNHVFISDAICDKNFIDSAGQFGAGNVFPLYVYPEISTQQSIGTTISRQPNLEKRLIQKIADILNLTFTNEKGGDIDAFAPIDLLDYIYSILHSPAYREKYKEFLKIDFPRIPYPADKEIFWQLVKLGGELRQIHLLESSVVSKYITKYPKDGSNIVEKPEYKDGNVWINSEQYFEGVSAIAWDFYIGGYQPAQKWLKDRKGSELAIDDIQHYQKIIAALSETDRIMKEIDKIEFM